MSVVQTLKQEWVKKVNTYCLLLCKKAMLYVVPVLR